MKLVWIGVKNAFRTDRCRHGSVYHSNGSRQLEINRRLQFVRKATKSDGIVRKATNYKLNCRDFFYLNDFVGGTGIMLLKFSLLSFPRHFLKPCLVMPKRGNLEVCIVYIYICAWLSRCGSFGIASVLQQFRATSTCCILSLSFIDGTSVLEFLQPFFLVTVRPTVAQSQRSCSTLNLWVPPDFRLFGFFKDENGQDLSLRFPPDIEKIWQEWKLTCDETTRSRAVRVHKWNIIPQFALHMRQL